MERVMSGTDVTRTLRQALVANATFSAIAGATFLLASGPLAALAGLTEALVLPIVGAALIPFAVFVVWLSQRSGLGAKEGRLVSVLDAQWVLGTVVLLIGWPDLLNGPGTALALVIAGCVGGFATWQWIGARRIDAAARA